MIHYHGGPITPVEVATAVWAGRHAFVSFEYPGQVALAAEICQTFALDNGAFTKWQRGEGAVDIPAYVAWVQEWEKHPGFDFALIPDTVDGGEAENDRLIGEYRNAGGCLARGIPVWHLHEPLERLRYLALCFPRVALGSSGQWKDPGSGPWWQRMGDAMDFICDEDGRPPCKLHGLRMLTNTIISHLPLASADSTNVAQNHNRERKRYHLTKGMAAIVLAGRIEAHACAPRWVRTFGHQHNHELIG